MIIYSCKICGGTLEFSPGDTVGTCDSCGKRQSIPKIDDDRIARTYDRAENLRRSGEFEKAAVLYEQIVYEDETSAEAYWSLVLCRFGVSYVNDPQTGRKMPTINRSNLKSVYEDEDYLRALEYADPIQREIYQADAAEFESIRKRHLELSVDLPAFDVFICYKQTDASGNKTTDWKYARELYLECTKLGLKTFFSYTTLQEVPGVEYEPYIFSALSSAKVMIVVTTRKEYLESPWVKNEWSRFMSLQAKDQNKRMFTAYRDMDPAQDLGALGDGRQALDLNRPDTIINLADAAQKLVKRSAPAAVAPKEPELPQYNGADVAPILKRMYLALDQEDFKGAENFAENVLNRDPECAEAYLGKLLVETKTRRESDLQYLSAPFDRLMNYTLTLRFSKEDRQKRLKEYNDIIRERNQKRETDARLAREQRAREQAIVNEKKRLYDQAVNEGNARLQASKENCDRIAQQIVGVEGEKAALEEQMNSLRRQIRIAGSAGWGFFPLILCGVYLVVLLSVLLPVADGLFSYGYMEPGIFFTGLAVVLLGSITSCEDVPSFFIALLCYGLGGALAWLILLILWNGIFETLGNLIVNFLGAIFGMSEPLFGSETYLPTYVIIVGICFLVALIFALMKVSGAVSQMNRKTGLQRELSETNDRYQREYASGEKVRRLELELAQAKDNHSRIYNEAQSRVDQLGEEYRTTAKQYSIPIQ